MKNIKNKKIKTVKRKRAKVPVAHVVALRWIFKMYSILFALLLFALFSYLYFMFASIYETALRKDYNIKIVNLKSEIAEKEAQILAIKEDVDVNKAMASGEYVKISEGSKNFAKLRVCLGLAR